MEDPAGTLRQPAQYRLVLVGELVVLNGVGRPSYENLLRGLVEESDEPLMPMVFGAAADGRSVQGVQRGD